MSADSTPYGGHEELRDGLPPLLLEPSPRWHPGAWLPPPGAALSFVSVAVLLALGAYLNWDPLRRALFRFPTGNLTSPLDRYYLAIPVLTITMAFLIFRACSRRPGGKFPHWWSLILVAISLGTLLYGVADRLWWDPYRGSPIVHMLAACTLFAVLTLAPRLYRVYPDSPLVQNAAPLALLLILPVGIGSAGYLSARMVDQEKERVTASVGQIRGLARDLESAANERKPDKDETNPFASLSGLANTERLKAIKLRALLPDKPVWQGAVILSSRAGSSLHRDLIAACDELIKSAMHALTSESRPRLRVAPFRVDETAEHWQPVKEFDQQAASAVSYYRELGRIFGELDGLHSTDAADALESARTQRKHILDEWSNQFDQRWMVPLVDPSRTLSPVSAMHSSIGNEGAIPFADLGQWKRLKWSDATKLTAVNGPCAAAREGMNWSHMESIQVPDPTREEPLRKKWIRVPYYYKRVECYSFVPTPDKTWVSGFGELHLIYKSRGGTDKIPDERPPLRALLYFNLPGENEAAYQAGLMDALGSSYREINGARAVPLKEPQRLSLPSGGQVIRTEVR